MATIHRDDQVIETGLTELVGKDEQIAQNEYGASVAVDINRTQSGGLITSVLLVQTEEDSGAILSVAGELLIFDEDPAVSAGDTALTAAEWKTCVGKVTVAGGDWITDGNGGIAYFANTDIGFHQADKLWLVFKLTSATSINSGATDDEVLECNIWYTNAVPGR